MQAVALNRALPVRDPAAAAMFVDSRTRRLIALFVGKPRSLSQVAMASNMDLKRLHHHAQKLCRLGLLRVVGEQKRAGRPIKLYQAASDIFFIDAVGVPRPFGEGLSIELQDAIARDHSDHVAGMLFTADADGRPAGRIIRREGVRTVAPEMWRILRLGAEDAEALKAEMQALLTKYERRTDVEGKVYVAHAAVALREEQDGPTDNQPRY